MERPPRGGLWKLENASSPYMIEIVVRLPAARRNPA
jgi:hypothetical protein